METKQKTYEGRIYNEANPRKTLGTVYTKANDNNEAWDILVVKAMKEGHKGSSLVVFEADVC